MEPDAAYGPLTSTWPDDTTLFITGLRDSHRHESPPKIWWNRTSAVGSADCGPGRGIVSGAYSSHAELPDGAPGERLWPAGTGRQFLGTDPADSATGCGCRPHRRRPSIPN